MKVTMNRKLADCRAGLVFLACAFVLALTGCATPAGPAASPGTTEPVSPPLAATIIGSTPTAPATATASVMPKPPAAAPVDPDGGARIVKGSGILVKPKPAVPSPAEGNNTFLNFDAADVREVARTILGEILRENYTVDPKVQGTITLRTVRPLAQDAMLPVLETVLRQNGAILVKDAGMYKILPAGTVKGTIAPRLGGSLSGYSVQIIPLRYVGAKEMVRILTPFTQDGAILQVDEFRNLLIVAGGQHELQNILDTVETFDVDWLAGMSMGLLPLKNADVKTVAGEVEKILGDKNLGPLAGVVRMIPIERMNAFVVISPQPEYIERARVWVQRLDRTGGGGGVQLFVYRVQNGKAESLADLLSQLFTGKAAGTAKKPEVAPGLTPVEVKSGSDVKPAAPVINTPFGALPATPPAAGGAATPAGSTALPGTDVRVIADKENNALLILATAAEYDRIESALAKLDMPPRQVLIEATIAEITLSDDLQWGLEWYFTKGPRQSGQLDNGAVGINTLSPGFSWLFRDGAGQIKGIFNALASDRRINVLSSPHIMVADNQTAKIQVGDSVPVAGPQSVTASGVVTNSVQYVETGVILTVTPRINAGGLVSMDITQEVSNASPTSTSAINSPTISKRSTTSRIAVQSGESVVLGGLIADRRSFNTSGLPLLSQIPLIGGLFGAQGYIKDKTELIVLLTPRVAADTYQARMITKEFRKKLGELEWTPLDPVPERISPVREN